MSDDVPAALSDASFTLTIDVREPSDDEVLFRESAKPFPEATVVLQQKPGVTEIFFSFVWCGFLAGWYALAISFVVSGTFSIIPLVPMFLIPLFHVAIGIKLVIALMRPNRYTLEARRGVLVATSRRYPKKLKLLQFRPSVKTQELSLSDIDDFAMTDALVARRDGLQVAEIFPSFPVKHGNAIAAALNNAYGSSK